MPVTAINRATGLKGIMDHLLQGREHNGPYIGRYTYGNILPNDLSPLCGYGPDIEKQQIS